MAASTIEYSLMAAAAYESTRGQVNRIPHPAGWDRLAPLAGLDHN